MSRQIPVSLLGSVSCRTPSPHRLIRCNSSLAAPSGVGGVAPKRQEVVQQRTVFSGIQPTGIPHLGNYLGALQTWLKLQSNPPTPTTRILFSIVGLHAITLPQNPSRLLADRKDCLACLLACGLGQGSTLYFQEQVQEHAELGWVLNCLTGVGRLARMTTWKSKLSIAQDGNKADQEEGMFGDLKLGLFAYPVLQAADVLLYKSTDIPVGEDQQQHLELARDIAETFNFRFGETFPLPRHMITPSKRVLSLIDPSQKMSKSAPNPSSRILITDSPSTIAKRIRSAVTDSDKTITYDPEQRRGVANLLTILAACEGRSSEEPRTAEQIAQALSDEGIVGHAALKSRVTEAVVERLAGIREEYERIRQDSGYLSEVARSGAEVARGIASKTMEEVRQKIGLQAI